MEKIGFYLLDEMPEVLTEKENTEYLKLTKQGDKVARDELIKHNLYIVKRIIENQYKDYNNKEELFAIGIVGLIRGIDTYKIENKSGLYNYLYKVTSRFIKNYLEQNKFEKEYLEDYKNDFDLLSDLEDDYCKEEEQYLKREFFEKYILRLTKNQQLIIKYHFYDCLSLTEIANKLGVTPQNVSSMLIRALNKMRRELTKYRELLKIAEINKLLQNMDVFDVCDNLTELEIQVFILAINKGLSNVEIADKLLLSVDTINYIMHKYYVLVNNLKRKNKTLSRQI